MAVCAERSTKHNQELLAQIPYYQDWRTAANGIKDYAIGNLDKLLVEFERNVTARRRRRSLGPRRRRGKQHRLEDRPGEPTSRRW